MTKGSLKVVRPAELAALSPRAELVRVCGAIVAVAVLREAGAVLALLTTSAERVVQAVATLLQAGAILAFFSSAAEGIIQAVAALL